jgi:hypothetical protein
MTFVTVFKALNAAEAELVRSHLEACDFPVNVVNELSALSLGAGGILVQVPDDRAEEARALIASKDPSNS